jgi:hypothetical protein
MARRLTAKTIAPATASIVVLGLLVAVVSPAFGQRTSFHGLLECSRFAAVTFKRANPAFKRFVIDRASVTQDRFSGRIGNQFISTIYHGKGTFEAAGPPKTVRFICLHGGIGRGPVFIYTLD